MWQVSVSVRPAAEETAADLLGRCFEQPATVFADARTGKSIVSVYLPLERQTAASLRRRIADFMKEQDAGAPGSASEESHPAALARRRIAVKKIRRENWAESWKRHFKPIEIGPALLIRPGWSRRKARRGQRVVVLDPGLSFGTGHHATTSFCLQQLALCRGKGRQQSFLDIGCGSGILAIAAAKLGYTPIAAFDFDPQAVRVSRQNSARNKVQDRVWPRQQDLAGLPLRNCQQWDVICANLTADLLTGEARRILARLQPAGHLILAGILRRQFSEVRKTFENFGLTLAAREFKNEWQSGRFVYQNIGERPGRDAGTSG